METLSILYDTQIDYEAVADYSYLDSRYNNIQTFSLVWKVSMLLVDHFKRDIHLLHNNPECSALLGKCGNRDRAPDNFPEGYVCGEDRELFVKIITAIKETMRNDSLHGGRNYYFTFNISMAAPRRKASQYSFIVLPYMFMPDKKVWVTGYQITPSESAESGNLKLHVLNESCYSFDPDTSTFKREEYSIRLSKNEKKVLKMSAEGCTEQQIADYLNINVATLKNKKIALFEKMEVNTIYAAISKAFKNGDI